MRRAGAVRPVMIGRTAARTAPARTATKVAGERRPGIDRAIALLETLAQHRSPMSVGEIARQIGAPRSSTYEIVGKLVDAKLLEPSGRDGQVYLGMAMRVFGRAYSDHSAHYRRIGATLDRLSMETGEMVQLCGLRRDKYVVLDVRDAPVPFRISTNVGQEVPIPWTASGRLLLSHMSPREVRDFVPPEDYRLPDGREISQADFIADINAARESGYSESSGLVDTFTWCMAAPVIDDVGVVGVTLCLVVPIETPVVRKAELLKRLRSHAQTLSETVE